MNDHHPIQSELSAISTLLAEMPKNTPFVAPEGYFDQLSNRIWATIEAQEIEKEVLSPLLQSLKKENPFSVHTAYLQEFKVNVTPKEAKVIPFFNLKAVLKYAAAAAVIGIIATFATLFLSGDEKGTIARASEETVISADAYDLFLSETASVEEEETDMPGEGSQSLLVHMDASTVSEMLTEIPENEISTYMDLIKNEGLEMMN